MQLNKITMEYQGQALSYYFVLILINTTLIKLNYPTSSLYFVCQTILGSV